MYFRELRSMKIDEDDANIAQTVVVAKTANSIFVTNA
jgi:hypothetical protein